VDCLIQLFLKNCRKCQDREDVDQRVINFGGLNMDIILYHFHAILPPLFHKLNDKSDENDDPKSGVKKGSARGTPMAMKKSKEATRKVEDFKMSVGETWERTFQGKCLEKRVKWMGSFVCPRYHTKGECWEVGCKYSKMHLPASAVPQNVKKEIIGLHGMLQEKVIKLRIGSQVGT